MFRVCVFVALCSFWVNVAPAFVPICKQPFDSYRHPEDCTRWIRCVWGKPWEMPSCQTGLRFSGRIQVCVPPRSEWDDCNAIIIDINECASNPCQNGGTCTDGVNSYTCACADGFTGYQCATDIDECASNPCQNGGTCTDGVNSYTCACADGFTGYQCATDMKATDCSDITLPSGRNAIGVYKVYIQGVSRGIDVFCDQGGWLVIQRRIDGSEDFYRGWLDYKNGFGDIRREFWLGNEHISSITNGRKFELRIELHDFDGQSRYAHYRNFSLGDASTNYTLTVGDYSGTAGDSLTYHSGRRFVTYDASDTTTRCAKKYKGGWWYRGCHHANLNGLYLNGTHGSFANGVEWLAWRGHQYSYKKVEMKIRRW